MVNAAFTLVAIAISAPSPGGTAAQPKAIAARRLQPRIAFAKGALLPPRSGISAPMI
jgi:hypothetical protein